MKNKLFIFTLLFILLSGCKKEPPVASFTFSPSEPEIGETVIYSNSSTNGTSYSWTFGDGATASTENATHVYSEAGNFPVELTAVNEDGSDSHMVSVVIGWPDPIANFSMSKTMVTPGENITFTNSSEWAESYSWDFGDGANSSVTDPTHSYSSEGLYTVTLTAAGYEGGSDEYSMAVNVCYPPEAEFIMDVNNVCAGEDISFTNQSEDATTYLWDFGDGSTSTQEDPVHSWSTGGIFIVTLTASGNCGSDTYTEEVTIQEVNIFPGLGFMDIEIGETWATIEEKMNADVDHLGYVVDNSGYVHHVYESESMSVVLYLVSPTASFSPSSDDMLWLMALEEDYIGSTDECIHVGSLLSEVVATYGDPDRYDNNYDSYIYDRLGIRFYYDANDIIDRMTVFPADAKKSTGFEFPTNIDIDNRNIKLHLRK